MAMDVYARSSSLIRRLRMSAGALVTDNAFRGLALLGKLHPDARPERHNVQVDRDVPYHSSGLEAHRLDVYRPMGVRGLLPVVLYVHGGGFRILSKDTHWLMGLAFARRGFVVFNINYRLAPRHPFPAAIEDACTALTWVARNAERYGGDPNCLVIAGESAGANLATSLAIAASYERPEPWARAVFDMGVRPVAVLPACGMLQVTDPGRFARRKPHMSRFVDDRLHEVTEAYLSNVPPDLPGGLDLADPLVFLERGHRPQRPLPPFFAVVGTRDPLLDDTRRLKAALDRLGVPCKALYYPGEIHAFHAMIWRPSAMDCWQQCFRFLDECLGSRTGRRDSW